MTQKGVFSAEEWATLTRAPALAAMAISAAERGGNLREGIALAQMYRDARSAQHSELVAAMLAAPPGLRQGELAGLDAATLLDRAAALVGRAAGLLRERATERELTEYGDFVVHLTQAVAHAHKEGGFLGVGGRPVSDAEHAALERIAYALGPRPGSPEAASG